MYYSTGKEALGVGFMATVQKYPVPQELEGSALVLADRHE
jgi:DNA replicative helicase MCM subunit Mcm2 (Cdc46/Mcm family)